MNNHNQDLLRQLMKTIRYHKNKMMTEASRDAFVSQDTNSPGLFFITETFTELAEGNRSEPLFRQKARYQIHQPKDLLDIACERHRLFYKHILNQTVPSNHFPSRKKDYPIALSFIDLAGSRFNRPAYFRMPDVHSIFIVPPKTMKRFTALLSDDFRRVPETKKIQSIKTTHWEEVAWDWNEISRVIDYSSKSYRIHSRSHYYPKESQSLFFQMHG
jgi:hypothetical protein